MGLQENTHRASITTRWATSMGRTDVHPNSTDQTKFFKGTLAELRQQHPTLNQPVVDGLLRAGETANIIADPKIGKSWLAYSLGLSVVAGWSWLDKFPTTPGRVLLIDNELHPGNIANRIPTVAHAMGVDDYADDLDVWSLRGHLHSLIELGEHFDAIEPGEYQLIILDAKYRFAIEGASENDNAAEALFYNRVDGIARSTGAAIAMIHHASKGLQGDKRVSDVGAGAGAQSRAADCHMVLRQHDEPGHMVMDAVVRSFKPVESIVLRWEFPLWHPVEGIDPTALRCHKTKQQQSQSCNDKDGIAEITAAIAKLGRATKTRLREHVGMGMDRLTRLLAIMVKSGIVERAETTTKGGGAFEYWLATNQENERSPRHGLPDGLPDYVPQT